MSSARLTPLYSSPPSSRSTKLGRRQFTKPLHCSLFPTNQLACSLQLRRGATLSYRPSFKIFCKRSKTTQENEFSQGFSVLSGDSPWEVGKLWSTLAFYIFNLHIPLSFGGLSVVAQIIGKNLLVPQTEPVNNSTLKEILLSSDVSRVACVVVYCILCPLLEEIVYRGFLLTSLSSSMEWLQAVAVSSAIFSAGHFSGESFLQLFIIGCVLGCSYCWTGNLKSPLLIHSLYNALTLIISYLY